VLASLTRGHEIFSTVDSAGNPVPRRIRVSKGVMWESTPDGDLPVGSLGAAGRSAVRQSQRPVRGNKHQVSPRVKLSFFPDPANTVYLYYARLFLPPTSKICARITSVADSGVADRPTLPERDHFFE